MRKIFLLHFFLLFFSGISFGQIPTQAQAEQELQNRGLDKNEVRRRMMLRGYDLESMDPNNPVELLEAEGALRNVVAEMEAEKRDNQAAEERNERATTVPATEKKVEFENEEEKAAVKTNTDEIQDAVKEGATFEEAVSEQVNDALTDSLPKARTWGQQVFRNKSIKLFRKSEDVKPPDSYVLGVGDFITVSIWGQSEEDVVFEINKEGYIKPVRMDRINLKGLTLADAKKKIKSRFSKFYKFRPQDFELTLNFSRTINVNISGEAFYTGSFNLPAINTAFNALVAGGGPTDIGSVRNIELYRSGKKIKNIDVYKFLLNPATQEELYLEENDFIHIPIADRVVLIRGAVNRPTRYELIQGENLIDLIRYAGGLKDDALRGNIQIKRIANNEEIILDASLDELQERNTDFELKTSDVITINTINKGVQNQVNISGTVEFPGSYAYFDGIRISDLLKKAVLKEEARNDIAYLQRYNLDGTVQYVIIELGKILENTGAQENLKLKNKDRLIVYSQEDFVEKYSISVGGFVKEPGTFPYDSDDNLRIRDLVLLGGGLEPNATKFGYIKRMDPSNLEVKDYLRVNISEALANPESIDNIKLEPYDQLTIFDNESFTDVFNVSIEGAVRRPDTYEFVNGIRVSDLIFLSKGLKPDATDFAYIERTDPENLKAIEYLRVNLDKAKANPGSVNDVKLNPLDRVKVYSKLTYIDDASVSISGSVRNPGKFKFDESLKLSDMIMMAGGLKMEAAKNKVDIFRIEFKENKPTKTKYEELEIDEDLNVVTPGLEGFELQPYDQVVIRNVPDFEFQKFVRIEGEVFYPGSYAILDENEPLSSLVKRSGGLTDFSFPEGATLYRPQEGVGFVVIQLKEALNREKSDWNILLKDGDVLRVPKVRDLVSISGATNAKEYYPDKVVNNGNKINVPYSSGKRAMHYIRKHAGGISDKGAKKTITIEHPNGELKKTLAFGPIKITPRVRPGSIITVGAKPRKDVEKKEKKKKETDWENVFGKTMTQVTSLLTLILLIQRLD